MIIIFPFLSITSILSALPPHILKIFANLLFKRTFEFLSQYAYAKLSHAVTIFHS